MNYKTFKEIKISRLGMGNMRLPQIGEGKDHKAPIDFERANEIIEYAMSHGINYYDTAYVYNGGDSEKFLGKAMAKYDRDSYYLATKWHMAANPDYKAVFEEQLKRLNTDRIDFYLIHCLTNATCDPILESGAIEFFLKMKEEGKIRYLGFSSHADCPALRKFASHNKWDFAQLQINYFDWKYSSSAEEYKILDELDIPIVVMEPVRGGRLAKLTPEAEALLKASHPDWSIAKWALKFVQSLPRVQVILSGMSSLDQIVDNVETFSEEKEGLDEKEKETLFKAVEIFKKSISVPCTGCRYCTEVCPMEINIPEYLSVYNTYKSDGAWGLDEIYDAVISKGKAFSCINCGACMGRCPQNIEIPTLLDELNKIVGKK